MVAEGSLVVDVKIPADVKDDKDSHEKEKSMPFFRQIFLLTKLFWREKKGNWQESILQILFPIYPLLLFVFLLETDIFPYERNEHDAVPAYPEFGLANFSAGVLSQLVLNPALLGFAPSNNVTAMNYARNVCDKLGVNFNETRRFADLTNVEAARNDNLLAAVVFEESDVNRFTLVHRDLTELVLGLSQGRDSRLQPLTKSEGLIASGIPYLQSVVNQVLLEKEGVTFSGDLSLSFQMLPDDFGVTTQNAMEFIFPLMFIGSLFFSLRSIIFSLTLQAERGITEALELKGMIRNALWTSALFNHFMSTMLTVIVLVPLVYATGFLNSVSFINFFGCFTLMAWAQTSFGIMIVCLVGDKVGFKAIFGLVIFIFIVSQAIYIFFQAYIVPRDYSDAEVEAFFWVYLVPFGHILSVMTEAELRGTDLLLEYSNSIWVAYQMLFVDGIVYFVIALLIDNYRQYKKRSAFTNASTEKGAVVDQKIEYRGIQIRNLVKEFDQSRTLTQILSREKVEPLRAVDNLSLDVKENEIFCLLGHNGAGKTTTFNCLIGSMAVTSGDAWIHGLHITEDRNMLRKNLGVCPQFDIVMDNVTARDQLVFQAQIAGMDNDEAEKEADELLKALELEFKANEYPNNMSGGQKRRLTLALALIGRPAVIVLDEPTTGLDPNNRRHVWEILQKLKKEHTIIMTTHSLEEADALADTIAIMTDGKLKVQGSSLQLKREHGSGYRLTCLRYENNTEYDEGPLLENISQYVNDVSLISNVGAEVSFGLPLEQAAKFPALFDYLEKDCKNLGIQNFGISPTTLEDVFLNLDMNLHAEEEEEDSVEEDSVSIVKGGENIHKTLEELEDDCEVSNFRLFLAMGGQTLTSIRRNKLTFGFLIMYPIVFTIAFVYVFRLLTPESPSIVPISFLDQFRVGTIPFSAASDQLSLALDILGFSLAGDNFTNATELYSFLDNARGGPIGGYAFLNVNKSANDYSLSTNLMFDQSKTFSMPVLITELFNGLSDTSNVPLVSTSYLAWQSDFAQNDFFGGGGVTYLIAVALAAQGTHFCLEMLNLRKSGAKEMILLTGVPRWMFWLSHFCAHLLVVIIPGFMVYVVLLAYGEAGADDTSPAAYLVLFLFFGFPTVFFGYAFSFAFDDEEAAQQFSAETAGILLLVPWVLVTFVFDEQIVALENVLTVFIPGFGVYRGLALISAASSNGIPFTLADCFDWDKLLAQTYFFLLLGGLFYAFIVFIIESSIWSKFKRYRNNMKLKKHSKLVVQTDVNNLDDNRRNVGLEEVRQGILPAPVSAIPDVEESELKIHCKNVNKSFVLNDNSVFQAVNQATFGVTGNNIFGLLGPNGAGKTTLIKCITGLDGQIMDSGDAYIHGYDVVNERTKVLPLMGICPQFDALIYLLTGREVLTLFARIRGVKEGNVKALVNKYLDMLNLTPKANARCSTYSGGNKRRLSVAMSMIGSPRALFLDEPTTGLDPATRRKVWKFLQISSQSSGSKNGRAIVLTTHSMEEADALCSRIAIMVNSSIRTVGSSQELKTNYGSGTQVILGINKNSDFEGITSLMESLNPKSTCVESSESSRKFFLPGSSVSWSKIFQTILQNQEKLLINDFSVSQRTLEDVFIEFANLQPNEDED